MFFSIFLIIGAFAGTLAGLLGLGGGIIVVPALAAVFANFNIVPTDSIMQMAVGTSLATIVITFLSSLRSHMNHKAVRWDVVKMLVPGLVVGVIVGALIAADLPSSFLRIFFSVFLYLVAWRMLKGELKRPGAGFPASYIVFVITFVIGILSSILGAGGGIVLIPFMIRCQMDMREATGTSVACGVVLSLVATICFMLFGRSSMMHIPWSTGFIYWPAFLGVAVASVLFAPLGTAIAYRLPVELLKRILAIFLILVATDMLIPTIRAFLS